MIFSSVSPLCAEYGKDVPVYTFYNDGSWSILSGGVAGGYFRTNAGVLTKPAREYTINELADITKVPTAEEVYGEL